MNRITLPAGVFVISSGLFERRLGSTLPTSQTDLQKEVRKINRKRHRTKDV
jgi:hypothetical protein